MKSKSRTSSAAAKPTGSPVTKSAPVRKPRSRKITSVEVASDVANDAVAATVPTEMIATRAYAIFLEQGAEHGRDLEHWLTAERELMAKA